MAIDLGNTPTGTPPTAGEKLQIRSAIGVGTTDAPTFLAQTLTGQSLTGTQATSLVDLSATWNTSGTPSAIKLNVTETGAGSNAASNLMDLQVDGVSKLKVTKTGDTSLFFLRASSSIYAGVGVFAESYFTLGGYSQSTRLYQDAPGILAQRNGSAKQVHRVYNTFLGTTANEWGGFDWLTTTNTLRIGTEHGGTGQSRPIDFVTGGTKRAGFTSGGNFDVIYNLSTAATFYFGASFNALTSPSAGVVKLSNLGETDFGRLQLGGTTSAFPAIKRNGTGIDIRLADDSAFAPVKGKLTTDTAYTATVVTPTGFLTLYDSTGTAYRVPCVV